MAFFASAITTLQTLVIALGAGLGVWGVVNLLEGYGSDNPGSKSQVMKQLMAGGGIIDDLINMFPFLLENTFAEVIHQRSIFLPETSHDCRRFPARQNLF